MGIEKYYEQFKDDEDLYPVSNFNDDCDDDDCDTTDDEQQNDEWDAYTCCGGHGCMSCLGVSW